MLFLQSRCQGVRCELIILTGQNRVLGFSSHVMRLQFWNRNECAQTIPATEGERKVKILITLLSNSYNEKIYDETKWTNSNPILFYDLYKTIRPGNEAWAEHEKQL